MKSRNVLFSLIIITGILVFAIVKKRMEPQRHEFFKRQPKDLAFTAYALCRMECYSISREDVSGILKKGVILLNKSNTRSSPCPIYALQGHTASGLYIRVLFEQCRGGTRVISCYYLRTENKCDCPVS